MAFKSGDLNEQDILFKSGDLNERVNWDLPVLAKLRFAHKGIAAARQETS